MRLSIFFLLLCLVSCKSNQKLQNLPLDPTIHSQLKKDVSFLADDRLEGRLVGTDGELMAAEYCVTRFKEIGLKPMSAFPDYRQNFTLTKKPNPHSLSPTGDFVTQNVIGWIDNGADNHVIIGAHYDHLGYGHFGTLWDGDPEIHNGADDNASGTSAVMAIAKKIIEAGPKNNNYIFLLFSGEEMGLWGSNYYTKNSNVDLTKVNYMLNLDMVGRLNAERTLALNGTGTSPKWKKVLDKNNRSKLKLVKSESGVGPSDHTSFYNNDIPVIHFFTGQHSDYHKPSDDADLVNYTGIQDIVQYITNIVIDLDDEGKIAFSKTNDESEVVPDFKVTLGVMPDYLFDGLGMRIDGVKEGRPAFKADIKKGDVVIKMGDFEVKDMMSYMTALGGIAPGSTVQVTIIREGKTMEKEVSF